MKNICGIYSIRSICKNKIYIGASVDIRLRWRRHRSELKLQIHPNIKLQRHYNKYGIEDLEFQILGEFPEDQIFTVEVEFVQKFNSFKEGFNLTTGGEGYGPNKRKITLKNIETLEIKEFESLSDAARALNTSPENIWSVIEGKGSKGPRRICAGWCRPETETKNIKVRARQKYFKVIHPEHGTEEGWCQRDFCRKYNLNYRHFARVVSEEIKTCHGWKLHSLIPPSD